MVLLSGYLEYRPEEQFSAHRDRPYEHEFMDRFVNGRITGADT